MSSKPQLIMQIATFQTQMFKRVDQFLSPHGISFSELMVLSHLANAPNRTLRRIDLANQTGLTASGVTRLLNPMEKTGLVQKEQNPRDARVSLVRLSAAGERIYNEAMVSFTDCADSILKPLGSSQIATLSKLMQVLN